jgi:hypothetical protein
VSSLPAALDALAAAVDAARLDPSPAARRALSRACRAYLRAAGAGPANRRPELLDLVDAVRAGVGAADPVRALAAWAEAWPAYLPRLAEPGVREAFLAAVAAAGAPPGARGARRWERIHAAARRLGLGPPEPESLDRLYRRERSAANRWEPAI